MSEERFYPLIGEFLKRKGFEHKEKLRVNFSEAEIEKYGQKWCHFDIFGYGDQGTWAIECKQGCTIEVFGLALGQLIIYKQLVEDNSVRKKLEDDVKRTLCNPLYFSLALGESKQWTLRRQTATYKGILDAYDLPFGVLLITRDQEVQEIIPAQQ